MFRSGPVAQLLALTFSACVALAIACIPASAEEAQSERAGLYDGHQTEVAAWLLLEPDGRYRYRLSYGALDEGSSGTWSATPDGVELVSDPSTPPEFELLAISSGDCAQDSVCLSLDVPDPLPLELFTAVVTRADQSSQAYDFATDGVAFPAPVEEESLSIRLHMPMMGLAGDMMTMAVEPGQTLRYAFHPNDFGFVAFDHQALPDNKGALILERHGLRLRFERVSEES